MIKKFYYLVFLIILAINVNGQQIPQYSQYIWNNYLINPAIAGAENYFDVKAGYRDQWVGMADAPRTLFFTANGQIGKKLENQEYIDVIDKSIDRKPRKGLRKTFNVSARSFPKPPTNYVRKGHHGVGGQILNDRIGPFNTSALYLTYAYHIPLTKTLTASVGASIGAKQYRLNSALINFGDLEGDNTILPGNPTYGLSPDGSIGGLLYSEKFYIGIASNQLMGNKLSVANGSEYIKGRLKRHYFLNGGVRLKVSNDVAFVPSMMLRVYPNTPTSIDVNGKFNFMDILWIGASYRHKDAIVGLLGFSISKQLNFGYSYDFNTSKLNPFNKGTHEIVVGYRIINKRTNDCRPSYTW